MSNDRRPPIIDMTPEGEFRDAPQGAKRVGASWLDRALMRAGGVGALVAVGAGGLVLAGLAIAFITILVPVALIAAAVAAGSLYWRARRAAKNGQPFVMMYRR